MVSIKRKRIKQYSFIQIFLYCIIGYGAVFSIYFFAYSRPLHCLFVNPDDEIVDREDEWMYQNSVTKQWYHWRTAYTTIHNHTDWPIQWLNVPPASSLGVIVYLTTRNDLHTLNISFTQLSRLLSNNPRPVVIFHEGDFSGHDIQQALAHRLGPEFPLAFQRIQFSNSLKTTRIAHRRYPLSYLNMCRFFTLMLPNHPLLSLFTYYWRLDSHSYIFGSNRIQDPFEVMQQKRLQYAFIMASEEGDSFVGNLWPLFHQFLGQYCLTPSKAVRKTQTGWFGGYSLAIIFNNFAIANVSLFRDHSLMRAWLHTVDRTGGIYRHRWGDAPVHTLGVTQFLQRHEVARFRYFGYFHRREYVCANGIDNDLCKKQAEPFLTDPKIEYLNYDDGCWPSSQNLLCHYYPEVKL